MSLAQVVREDSGVGVVLYRVFKARGEDYAVSYRVVTYLPHGVFAPALSSTDFKTQAAALRHYAMALTAGASAKRDPRHDRPLNKKRSKP